MQFAVVRETFSQVSLINSIRTTLGDGKVQGLKTQIFVFPKSDDYFRTVYLFSDSSDDGRKVESKAGCTILSELRLAPISDFELANFGFCSSITFLLPTCNANYLSSLSFSSSSFSPS